MATLPNGHSWFRSPESLVDSARISDGPLSKCRNYSVTLAGTESSEATNPLLMLRAKGGYGQHAGGA